MIVDTTVQERAIAHPTDSKLLETARLKRVDASREAGVTLKQTYKSEGRELSYRAVRYAHARQFRRMRRVIRRQRTIVGRLLREIQRKVTKPTWALEAVHAKTITLLEQTQSRKNISGGSKLYSWHAPQAECINKGKSKRPYEFGGKVGIASTFRGNLIVGARAFAGNPYDGHTLWEQLDQASVLMQDTGVKPTEVTVDLGYRGVDGQNPSVRIRHRGKKCRLTEKDVRELKRRQAFEPIIGHLKADHRMDRCHLKGEMGDRIHAVLCAAGYNLRWLMRNLAKKHRKAFLALLQPAVTGNHAAYLSSADRGGQYRSSIPLEQSDVEAS